MSAPHPGGRVWHIAMRGRDPEERERTATPLELLFDLCFVVAIAIAAAELHHAITEAHLLEAVQGFGMVFFAIWWAWMNFTWFASAYDTDDALYRITTFVQMAGVLVLAAGIPSGLAENDWNLVVGGYVVMRVSMISQWLRVARHDPVRRQCALRYAGGIFVVQIFWTLLILAPEYSLPVWIIGMIGELAVPVLAERTARTTWHPHHITERYGLFTIIVLGESILAATTAFQRAIGAGGASGELVTLALSGLVIVFGMWWLYFSVPAHQLLTGTRSAFFWGYGHIVIFGSAAAVGAGLQVAVDVYIGESHATPFVAGMATAGPVALYLVTLWVVQIRRVEGAQKAFYPAVAVLILLTPFTGVPVQLTALLTAALVVAAVVRGHQEAHLESERGAQR